MLLIAALTLALLWLMLAPTVADPDLWGHLRYGLDNLASREVLRTDAYSYLSEPGTWVNHEWLAEVSFGLAYLAGGQAGLVALKLLLAFASLAAIYAAARERGAGIAGACVACLGTAAGLRPILGAVRPQMFTVLGFAVLLLILVLRERHPRVVWWLVPLYIMWTNAHGGFLAGVAILGLAVIVEGLLGMQRAGSLGALLRGPFLPLTAAGLTSLLATLVNPYGFGLWTFLLETATVARPEIVEWQPLASFATFAVFVGALTALGLWALYRSGRPRSTLLLVIYVVSIVMTTVAVRHMLFFAIAWGVLHADHLDAAGSWMLHRFHPGKSTRRALATGLAITTLVVWVAAFAEPLSVEVPEKTYPVRAIELIKRHLPEGRLVVYFDWGQYALWHLGPGVQVSMDGRRETVYDKRVYEQSLDMTFGYGDWDRLLRHGEPDLVLVSKAHAAQNLMLLRPGWRLVYEDPLCGLFAQEGSALADELAQSLPPSIPYDGYGWRFP
jgi:hypothetical protein